MIPSAVRASVASASDSEPAESERPEVGAVFRAHGAFVFRSLRRMGIADAQLDDAVQEVFLIVHRRIGEWEPRASIRSWLYAIARRVASHIHRSRARKAAQQWPPRDLAVTRTPEHALADLEELDFVGRFLAGISEAKRSVFVLADIEEMTAPEIADALEIPINTVYSRLRLTRAAFNAAVAERSARAKEGDDAASG